MSNQRIRAEKSFVERYMIYVIIITVSFLGFAIYSNSYSGSFHLDDLSYIKQNGFIKSFDGFWNWGYWLDINQRPLSTLTFAFNYYVNDLETPGYHIVNVLIHVVTSIIVFFLSKMILERVPELTKKNGLNVLGISLLLAVLYVSHPIQTQTVNYIVQRMTLMAAMFYYLSIICYLKARTFQLESHKKKAFIYYVLVIFMFGFSILSKQNAATLPLVLLLIEILFVRKKDGKISLTYIRSFLALFIVFCITLIISDKLPLGDSEISRRSYFITQLSVIFVYIKTLFFPLSLNFDPLFPISNSLWGSKELFSLAGHIVILILGVASWKKNKLITFGIFWFYITLSVESSIIPLRDVAFDHRLYLPLYGFIVVVVVGLYSLLPSRKKVVSILFIFLILFYSGVSYSRNKVWENEITFWSDVIKHSPVKARPYRFLGIEYMAQGQFDKALEAFEKALEIEPRWQEYNNKASIYKHTKKYELAIKELSVSIEMNPGKARLYLDRADLYLKIKEFGKSESDLVKASKIDTTSVKYYVIKGKYFLQTNGNNNAIKCFDQAVLLEPSNIDALNNRGVAKMREENYAEAIHDFSSAILLNRTLRVAYKNRGAALFNLGRYHDAIKDYNYLIVTNKKDGTAYRNRGMSLLKLKKYQVAYSDLNKAVSLGQDIDRNLINDLRIMIEEKGN